MSAVARALGGPKVDALYNLMQSFENKLGGGEGIEGLYGSLTQNSMQKVLDCFKHNSGLDSRSAFVDVGAGLGRPILHAMVTAGLTAAWGVELDHVKCSKAAAFCGSVMGHLVAQEVMEASAPVPPVICSPIERVSSLDPATHAYSFWEGVPPSGKAAFGELFAKSKTLRAVAVVQRAIRQREPAAVMRELGFGPLLLIASFPVKMSGSGRSFTCYVFTKIAPAAATFIANAAAAGTPGRVLPAPAEERCGKVAGAGTPAAQVESPAKARRPETEPGLASPAKKAAAEPLRRQAAGGDTAAAGVQRPAAGPAPVRARAPQQVLLTSLPEYSRRTKQGLAGAGKTAGGKGAGSKGAAAGVAAAAVPTRSTAAVPTRSSSRLAAKALALAAASQGTPAVEGY